jgi:hypothetical protein
MKARPDRRFRSPSSQDRSRQLGQRTRVARPVAPTPFGPKDFDRTGRRSTPPHPGASPLGRLIRATSVMSPQSGIWRPRSHLRLSCPRLALIPVTPARRAGERQRPAGDRAAAARPTGIPGIPGPSPRPGIGSAQPRRWSIAVVTTTTVLHRRGKRAGPPGAGTRSGASRAPPAPQPGYSLRKSHTHGTSSRSVAAPGPVRHLKSQGTPR